MNALTTNRHRWVAMLQRSRVMLPATQSGRKAGMGYEIDQDDAHSRRAFETEMAGHFSEKAAYWLGQREPWLGGAAMAASVNRDTQDSWPRSLRISMFQT